MSDARSYHQPLLCGALIKDASVPSYSRFDTGRLAPFLALSLTCVLTLVGCTTRASAPSQAPPTVEVVSVVQQDVPIYSEWVAVLDGYVNAQIQPHVTGYLIQAELQGGIRRR